MELSYEQIVSMAVAAICEETGEAPENIRVVSFREAHKSPLQQYIADNNIHYHKYQLGE